MPGSPGPNGVTRKDRPSTQAGCRQFDPVCAHFLFNPTIRTYTLTVDRFAAWLPTGPRRDTGEITPEDIRRYLVGEQHLS